MKQCLWLILGFAIAVPSSLAQTVDTTVCAILANPQSFDGKIVRIKGTVIAGFDEFAVKDADCKQPVNAIWLSYPEGTKAKAGPVAFLQLQLAKNSTGTAIPPKHTAVQLERNKDFKQFDSLLSTPYKGAGICPGCGKFTVTATLVGRLDGVKVAGAVRDGTGKFIEVDGFGNLNAYTSRIVLQSVAEVMAQEIDYSKAAAPSKGESDAGPSGGDPVAAVGQSAKAFPDGSSAAGLIGRAAAAFGKEGEDNGVNVSFGVVNEARQGDGGKGEGNSPDGLLFNCTFASDRLKGAALSEAVAHVGNHIADIRADQADLNAFHLELRAWLTAILVAAGSQQKTLTLPGGFLAWSSAWSPSENNKLMDEAITSFLTTWASFEK